MNNQIKTVFSFATVSNFLSNKNSETRELSH